MCHILNAQEAQKNLHEGPYSFSPWAFSNSHEIIPKLLKGEGRTHICCALHQPRICGGRETKFVEL